MPSSENETLLMSKKQKKNKTKKLKSLEVSVDEEENGHENGNDITEDAPVADEEVSLKKQKKNKKKKQATEEQAEKEVEVEESAEKEETAVQNDEADADEEEEMKITSQSKSSSQESTYQMDHSKVNEVVKSLNDVNTELIEQFRATAQKVVKKHNEDPVVPLAAAIAILSGATKVITKSLLTQREVMPRFHFI